MPFAGVARVLVEFNCECDEMRSKASEKERKSLVAFPTFWFRTVLEVAAEPAVENNGQKEVYGSVL